MSNVTASYSVNYHSSVDSLSFILVHFVLHRFQLGCHYWPYFKEGGLLSYGDIASEKKKKEKKKDYDPDQ